MSKTKNLISVDPPQCAGCRWSIPLEGRYDQLRCTNDDSTEAWGDVEATGFCESFLPNETNPSVGANKTCFAQCVTWDNLQEIANWCSAADLYDTRVLLLISSPNGEQIARVGDTITKHTDGTFSVQNANSASDPLTRTSTKAKK